MTNGMLKKPNVLHKDKNSSRVFWKISQRRTISHKQSLKAVEGADQDSFSVHIRVSYERKVLKVLAVKLTVLSLSKQRNKSEPIIFKVHGFHQST